MIMRMDQGNVGATRHTQGLAPLERSGALQRGDDHARLDRPARRDVDPRASRLKQPEKRRRFLSPPTSRQVAAPESTPGSGNDLQRKARVVLDRRTAVATVAMMPPRVRVRSRTGVRRDGGR